MEHSRYVAPRLGIVTVLCSLLAMIAVAALKDNEYYLQFPFFFETPGHLSSIGISYGIFAWSCWLVTAVPHVALRLVLRLGIILVATYVELRIAGMPDIQLESVLRYSINFGGLVISQSVIFVLLEIPRWRVRRSATPAVQKWRVSIGEILILTLAVALLLAMASHYHPSIPDINYYWLYLFGAWILIPLTSAGSVTGMLDRRLSRRVLGPVIAMLLVSVGSIAMGLAEQRFNEGGSAGWKPFAASYGVIVCTSMAAMAILGLAGRIDAALSPETEVVQQHR